MVVAAAAAAVELTFSISRIRISSFLSCLMCLALGACGLWSEACGLLLLRLLWFGLG